MIQNGINEVCYIFVFDFVCFDRFIGHKIQSTSDNEKLQYMFAELIISGKPLVQSAVFLKGQFFFFNV